MEGTLAFFFLQILFLSLSLPLLSSLPQSIGHARLASHSHTPKRGIVRHVSRVSRRVCLLCCFGAAFTDIRACLSALGSKGSLAIHTTQAVLRDITDPHQRSAASRACWGCVVFSGRCRAVSNSSLLAVEAPQRPIHKQADSLASLSKCQLFRK